MKVNQSQNGMILHKSSIKSTCFFLNRGLVFFSFGVSSASPRVSLSTLNLEAGETEVAVCAGGAVCQRKDEQTREEYLKRVNERAR